MYFSCDVCGYKSNYKYNLKRHIKLKHSNCITHISQNGILDNSNDILLLNKPLEKLELNTRNDILFVDSEKSIPKQCLKCFKFFASVKTLNYHSKNCEGIITNPLKCEYCKRSFNNRQNKYKHVKVCKVKDALMILQEHNINNTDNANINNIQHNNHNNQQNIIINNIKNYGYKERYDSDLSDDEKYTTIERNDFGKERIDYITDDEMKKLCKGVNERFNR